MHHGELRNGAFRAVSSLAGRYFDAEEWSIDLPVDSYVERLLAHRFYLDLPAESCLGVMEVVHAVNTPAHARCPVSFHDVHIECIRGGVDNPCAVPNPRDVVNGDG